MGTVPGIPADKPLGPLYFESGIAVEIAGLGGLHAGVRVLFGGAGGFCDSDPGDGGRSLAAFSAGAGSLRFIGHDRTFSAPARAAGLAGLRDPRLFPIVGKNLARPQRRKNL